MIIAVLPHCHSHASVAQRIRRLPTEQEIESSNLSGGIFLSVFLFSPLSLFYSSSPPRLSLFSSSFPLLLAVLFFDPLPFYVLPPLSPPRLPLLTSSLPAPPPSRALAAEAQGAGADRALASLAPPDTKVARRPLGLAVLFWVAVAVRVESGRVVLPHPEARAHAPLRSGPSSRPSHSLALSTPLFCLIPLLLTPPRVPHLLLSSSSSPVQCPLLFSCLFASPSLALLLLLSSSIFTVSLSTPLSSHSALWPLLLLLLFVFSFISLSSSSLRLLLLLISFFFFPHIVSLFSLRTCVSGGCRAT